MEVDAEFLERLIYFVAAYLDISHDSVDLAVTRFLEAETGDLQVINAVMALGVDKRPGGPNDGADIHPPHTGDSHE